MMRKFNIFTIFLLSIFLLLLSCNLFEESNNEEKDTTDPIVNLTIEGGNEISREVTLYLDIEDDSNIYYVSIIIDDTTAVTVTSNFDTIRFDVTPFADENEHKLFAKVADAEGNIGESEKVDVVITEFPGWRIFGNIFDWRWLAPVAVDKNNLVWVGSGWEYGGMVIFDEIEKQKTFLNTENSNLKTKSITDIKIVENSKAWIANDTHIVQFDFTSNSWEYVIDLPDPVGDETSAWALTIDNNYDLWIGSNQGIYHYSGSILNKWYQHQELGAPRAWDIASNNDNTIFAGTDFNVLSIKNDQVVNYNYFTQNNFGDISTVTADHVGRIWISEGISKSHVYDGNTWGPTPLSGTILYQPLIITSSGLYITQAINRGMVIGDGYEQWIYFDELDSPFKEKLTIVFGGQQRLSSRIIATKGLAEAPNGDIWMVAGGELMRYRPSLGGYP